MTADPSTPMRVLLENECWDLLRHAEVGRLGVAIANQPDIFPINFVVDHGSVVFRSAEGTKLAAAVLGVSVAFEADGELLTDTGTEAWSVVIKGRAVEIEGMYELFDALELPLYPWHAAPKHRFVRIVPDLVTGRRFRVVDRATDHPDAPPHHDPPD